MTHRLTPAQAQANADAILTALIDSVSDWDKTLIEQAIEIIGDDGAAFSMNDVRDLLPDMAHHTAGLVFHSMLRRRPSPLVKVGEVRSTSERTHAKPIGVYVLARTRVAEAGEAA
jgi:hypothetical protein